MICKSCGGAMTGDGYTDVIHCENVDVIGEGYEPDANPVYCMELSESPIAAMHELYSIPYPISLTFGDTV